MTGTSARETSRPARRMNAPSGRSSSSIAPPVLFRLPPISLPAGSDSEQSFTDARTLRADVAVANSSRFDAQESQAAARAVQPTLQLQSVAAAAPTSAQQVPAAKQIAHKNARQQLLNVLIVVLLLVAVAIVSMLVFRNQAAKPALVNAPTAPINDPLATLAELKVPELNSKAGDASAPPNLYPSSSHEQSESLILGMDTGQLGKREDATAQVQLGAPVPMPELNSSSLANTQSNTARGSTANAAEANNSRLPLTTPRYETVSAPSAANESTDSPRANKPGDSPSLWDGAGKSTEADRNGDSGLVLGKPLAADPASGQNASTLPAAKTDRTPSSAQLQLMPQTSSPEASESVNLGVTVGGGLLHPTNLGQNSLATQSTATPDLDAASIARKYGEFKAQKNAQLVSRGAVTPTQNSQFGSTGGALASATSGFPNGYVNAGAAPNTAAAASGVPYGTTGGTLATPYVRNAQGAQPSGLNPASSSAPPPAGYSTNYPAASGGYAIPARTNSYPVRSDTNSSAPAPAASAPMPASPTYSSPTYASPTYANPSAAISSGAIPAASYANPSAQQGTNVPANVGMPAPGGAQIVSRAPQLASPNPSGQAPSGMIGQSGYATAPSGDFVGGAPVSVNGTLGYATSTVGGMPTDARPATSAAQGSTPYGAASTYGSTPQYR